MPGVLIKNVPRELHERLKQRAARHRRSMNRELLVLLEEALDDRACPPSLERIDQLRVHGRRPLTEGLVDEALIAGRA